MEVPPKRGEFAIPYFQNDLGREAALQIAAGGAHGRDQFAGMNTPLPVFNR
jgi:hypothetical protein